MIIQGDEYALPLIIKDGDTAITPEMIDGMVVEIDDTEYQYPSLVTYSNGKWCVRLTQKQTLKMQNRALIQAQMLLTTGDVINTRPVSMAVQNSIIKKVWQ